MNQTTQAGTFFDCIRSLLAFIDGIVYWLLSIIYQIFFNVAGANILDGETVFKLFGRIQLILGVFMLFQLGMTIIRGLVDPDSFTDSKKGVGNLITRIITAMVLLACIVPIRMPNGGNNEYERSVNNNGLLFGTLYSLQHRVLASNTIGKIILGNDSGLSTNMNSSNSKSNSEALAESSRKFTVGIFRSFFRINLVPEENRKKHEDGKPDESFAVNRLCGDNIDDQLEVYEDSDVEVQDLLDMVNEKCKPVDAEWWKPKWLPGVKRYVFAYNGLTSCLVSIFILVMLVSFTIDVAVRSIKLALLRLLAPIPIISYMNPNGKGDEAMKSWSGLVTSTYLDLFMRLSLIMFVIFIAQNIIDGGISLGINGDGPIGVMSIIFIILGLFMFAKKAPKFVYDALGIKGEPGGLFSGMGTLLGAGAVAAGMVGSAATNWRAAKEENKELHPGQDKRNIGRNLLSAVGGAVGGGFVGAKALMGKDGSASNVLKAQANRNAMRTAHSTLPGRIKDTAFSLATGQSLADKGNKVLEATSKASELMAKLKKATEEEGIKNGTYGQAKVGNIGYAFNYKQFKDAYEKRDANGNFHVGKESYNASQFGPNIDLFMDEIKKSQVQRWMNGATASNGKSYAKLSSGTEKLASMQTDLNAQLVLADDVVSSTFDVGDISTYGRAIGEANRYVSETKAGSTPEGMKQTMLNANSKNKK